MKEYDEIRDMVKHENELINQRLTWLGTFQGLLLAALAFAWDKTDAKIIVYVLSFLGTFVALSIGIGTCRANEAINNLGKKWDGIKPKDYTGLDIEGIRGRSGCFWWLMPGYFIPWTFTTAWLVILLVNCSR